MRALILVLLCTALLPAVSLDGPSEARGIVGSPFVCAILASGDSPLVYSASPLPAGLNVDVATGRISGTPTAVGSTDVGITATGPSGSSSGLLTITVDADSGSGRPSNAAAISVSSDSACSFKLTATGTAPVFDVLGLPSGMGYTPEGLIFGTPSGAGDSNVDISADNGLTYSSMVIRVLSAQSGAPQFILPAQPIAAVGVPFGCNLAAYGANSLTCSNLPTWLQLDTGTGTLTGTPTATATTVNLRLTASGSSNSASTCIAIPVTVPVAGDPLPNGPKQIEATVDSGLGCRISTSASAIFSTENLPDGLDLDAVSGLLTGTPTSEGDYNVIVTATPSVTGNPVSTTVLIRVRPVALNAPLIGVLVPPVLTVGAPASIAIPIVGGTASGFTLSGSTAFTIDSTGLISGTPTAAGAVPLRISADNASGSAVTTLMLLIGSRVSAAPLPMVPTLYRTTAGSAFAAALFADLAVESWSTSGLPDLIELAPFTGRLAGIVSTGATSNLFISASNASGSNTTNIVLRAAEAVTGAPQITTAGPWLVGSGQPVRIALQSDLTATWTVSGLPAGLTADASGMIAGQTIAVGSSNLSLTAKISSKTTRTTGLILVESTPVGAPVFTNPGVLHAIVDKPFDHTLSASLSPVEYTIIGAPAWLTLVSTSGNMTGTPTDTDIGTFTLPVTARNASGTSRTTIVLQVGTSSSSGSTGSSNVSGVSGGGCGAGSAGAALLCGLLLLGLRRRR
jgi:large repetitive protein